MTGAPEPTYTFFLRGFETVNPVPGLTLNRAFGMVVEEAGYWHHFEWHADPLCLVLEGRRKQPSITQTATMRLQTDATRELMAWAIDGKLAGFMALPDAEFQNRFAHHAS